MKRFGMSIPLTPLDKHGETVERLFELGYTDLWSSETAGTDAFTPLALASVWAPQARLGTAIVPAFTRGPACLAQSVASLAAAAPGRFVFGIGTSSDVIVERWNSRTFTKPLSHTRDMIRFLREALTGAKVTEDYDTFSVQGFRLDAMPDVAPPILVGALREGMLRLAGSEGDGAIINWLSAEDVKTVTTYVHEGGSDKEIVARIFVCPSEDADKVRANARRFLAAYLNVPVYAKFHDWLGRGPQLQGMWDRWGEGDRKGALEEVSDELIDELIVHGSPQQCREHIDRYVEAGVTTPALGLMPFDDELDPVTAAESLAPR